MSSFITLLIKGSKINESAAHNVILQQKSTKEEIDFHIFRQEEAITVQTQIFVIHGLTQTKFLFSKLQFFINNNFIFRLTD